MQTCINEEVCAGHAGSEGTGELEFTEVSYFQLETNKVVVLQHNEIKTFEFIFIRQK